MNMSNSAGGTEEVENCFMTRAGNHVSRLSEMAEYWVCIYVELAIQPVLSV